MNLDNVKIVLEIEDDSKDELLITLLTNAANYIKLAIDSDKVPEELFFIAEEVCVKRYRKLGGEGISTEKVDCLSTTYVQDDFQQYKKLLSSYKDKHTDPKKLRLI